MLRKAFLLKLSVGVMACMLSAEALAQPQGRTFVLVDTLTATLTGEAAVPEPGDPEGSGTASVILLPREGKVCFLIRVQGIGSPTEAHIHRASPTESFPIVVDFDVSESGLSGCKGGVEPALMRELLLRPSEYYVNVHNEEYPAGAVRGQLQGQ